MIKLRMTVLWIMALATISQPLFGAGKIVFSSARKDKYSKYSDEGDWDLYQVAKHKYRLKATVDFPEGFDPSIIDENTELTVSCDAEPGESFGIWTNDGEGVFSSQNSVGDDFYYGAVFGDIDGDGLDDAVLITDSSNEIWLNQGPGKKQGFVRSGEVIGAEDAYFVALGDANNDGYTDALLIFKNSNQLWLNDGHGTFPAASEAPGDGDGDACFLKDLNGDGFADIVLLEDNRNFIWFNDGENNFERDPERISIGYTHLSDGELYSLGDLDGDGDLDAVLVGDTCNPWINDGTGLFTKNANEIAPDESPDTILIGDVNNDGFGDAVLVTLDGNQIWLNDGHYVFDDSGSIIGGDDDGECVSFANIDDRDGVDVVLAAGEGDHEYADKLDLSLRLSEASSYSDNEKYNKDAKITAKGGSATFIEAEDLGWDVEKWKKLETIKVKWNAKKLSVSIKGGTVISQGDEYNPDTENLMDLSEALTSMQDEMETEGNEEMKKLKSAGSYTTNCRISFAGYYWTNSGLSFPWKADMKRNFKKMSNYDDEKTENFLGSWKGKCKGTFGSAIPITD